MKRRKLIERAIDQAFDDGGDPVDNLIVAALDNRKLSQAIGGPLRHACAKVIREAINRAQKHVEPGELDRLANRRTFLVPSSNGGHRRVTVTVTDQTIKIPVIYKRG